MPIKTFASFEVDPLAGITGVLAKLEQQGRRCWIQILARPLDDAWQEQGKGYIDAIKGGAKKRLGQAASPTSAANPDLHLLQLSHGPVCAAQDR
jgi:hypothetical protein